MCTCAGFETQFMGDVRFRVRSLCPSSSPTESFWSEACEVDLEARKQMHTFLYQGLQTSVVSFLQSGMQSIAFDLDSMPSARSVIMRTDSECSTDLHNVRAAALCEAQDSSQAAHVYLCLQGENDTQARLAIQAYHSRDGVDFELHYPSETPETPRENEATDFRLRATYNWSMWRWRQPRLGILKLVIASEDKRLRVNYVACAVRCVHETAPCSAGAARASTLDILMPARSSHRDPWILNEIKVYASDSVDGEERLIQPLGITVMHGMRVVACFNPFSISNRGFYSMKQFPTGASLFLCAQQTSKATHRADDTA